MSVLLVADSLLQTLPQKKPLVRLDALPPLYTFFSMGSLWLLYNRRHRHCSYTHQSQKKINISGHTCHVATQLTFCVISVSLMLWPLQWIIHKKCCFGGIFYCDFFSKKIRNQYESLWAIWELFYTKILSRKKKRIQCFLIFQIHILEGRFQVGKRKN